MRIRLVRDQKMFKECVMALVSHMQNFKNGFPATIFNMVTNSTSSNEASSASLMNDNWLLEDLHGKKKQESEMQKELDNFNDSLTFEKHKFRSLRNEKDAELQAVLTKKRNLEMQFSKLNSQG